MRSDPFYMTYISANGIGDYVEKNDDYENGSPALTKMMMMEMVMIFFMTNISVNGVGDKTSHLITFDIRH